MIDAAQGRVPVRAAFAYAGGGSLGTFLAGITRTVLSEIRRHNAAVREGAPADDPRYLHHRWGRITIDAVAGTSAGALCSAQLVKALFEPDYADDTRPIDAQGTCTGDWIHGASFDRLRPWGTDRGASGPVESPGWALLSGARLHQLATTSLNARAPAERIHPDSPLDPSGVVAIGITLTDLLGYHDPAEFDPERVLGHPDFGCSRPTPSQLVRWAGRPVRDLGSTGHAEVRKLFVARDDAGDETARRFLLETRRRGRARCVRWSGTATERLAALCTASAALPFALGPVALTDRAGDVERLYRRLYMDGGIMNNRPVAPALELARWHDMMRLLPHRDPDTGSFRFDTICEQLHYERVCFFLDAFPDRREEEWRAPHPDTVQAGTGSFELSGAAIERRTARISDALARPTAGLDAFFATILNSMRGQDMRVIARTNARLRARDEYIDRLLHRPPYANPDFRLDTPEQAVAVAAVLARPAAAQVDEDVVLRVASRVWEADGFSELEGRRPVTMVPLFAPTNLVDVFAGEGLYAMGGLTHRPARLHDARMGAEVAQHVVAALRTPEAFHQPVRLPPAPESALPSDASAIVERLQAFANATIEGTGTKNPAVKWIARAPIVARPLVRRLTERLTTLLRGASWSPGDAAIVTSDDTPGLS
jgi:predicted acylesterase/phospholipase RssA